MPPESPPIELMPPTPPLLALIRNVVAAVASSRQLADKPVHVHTVEPLPDGMSFGVEAQGINFLVDGPYRVDVAVLRTSRDSTLCDVRIVEGRMVSKLFNWGMKLVPNSLMNSLLQGKAGGAVKMEGDRVAINHAALIAWLMKR